MLAGWWHVFLPVVIVLLVLVVAAVLRYLKREKAAATILSWAEWTTGARLYMLQKAVEREPGNARLHSELGALLLTLGRVAEAVAELEQAAKLEPGDARVLLLFGQALKRRGQLQQALLVLQRSLERDPHGRQGRAARKEIDSISQLLVHRQPPTG